MEHSIEEFIEYEKEVWEAFCTGDELRDKTALTEDFLGVYETGYSDREAHCAQLRNGPIASSYELSEERLMPLSEDIVLLTYLATWKRQLPEGAGPEEKMYISSIWKRNGDDWKNIFSQDTPMAD